MSRNVFKKFGSIRAAFIATVGFPLLIATSAYAQNPPPAAAGEATTERVTVTGSYIPTAEGESALPVTVYQADVIQKAGANTPAEGLRQLPSFVGNTVTENDSNGGDGTAAVSLRGLGPNNTLTLINNRRAFLSVSTVTYTNINAIPIGAVSRIEILKDGASAAYGSDAVAGVVNFILLNGPGEAPYEGAEIFALYGNTTDTDARVWQGYVKGGVTGLDGKVSIAGVGEYYNREALFSRDRDIAASADRRALGGNNQGSPTYAGRISYRTDSTDTKSQQASTLIDLTNADPKGGGPGGGKSPDYRKFDAAGAGTDDDRFNFRAFTPAIPGMEKASYYVTGRYKIFDDMLQMYGDILYTKQKQANGLAAAPFGIDGGTLSQSEFNPFVGASDGFGTNDQLRSATYRLVNELGNRNSFYDYDYYRYTLGFNGDFNVKDNDFISNWSYNTGMVYYRSDQLRIDSGDATATGIFAGITDGIDTDGDGVADTFFNPFIGQNAPSSGTSTTYDGEGNVTGTAHYDNTLIAQQSAYLGHSFFYERDYLYDITVNANLFPGLYNGGISMAGGFEYRHNAYHQVPDPVQVAGDQLGFNASANTKYQQEVHSYFGEVKIPLVISTMNVPWMRSAELSFAYRFEEFHNEDLYFNGAPGTVQSADFDNGGTPRVSVRIQPIEDITLRASWGQSFRSPFPFQLFDPAVQNFPNIFDAYFSGILQPPQGVFQAGTPGLQPEETDVWAAGMVLTPRFLKGFTMTVDFYQEFTTNLIVDSASLAQIMVTQNALDLLAGNPPSFVDPDGPGQGALGVTRDGTGALSAVDSATTNAGKRLVTGMDIFASYELPLNPDWGRFTISSAYNYFFAWKAQASPGFGYTNYLGDYSAVLPLSPGAIPYHKGFLRSEWEWRGWDFLSTVNYISSFNDDSAFVLASRPISGTGANPAYPFYRRCSDYITLDMQLSYEFRKPVTEAVATSYAKDAKDAKSAMAPVGGADNGSFAQRMLWNTRITVGVNNAFDRNPPTVLGAFNDNYDTSLYTVRNRYWYTSISKKF